MSYSYNSHDRVYGQFNDRYTSDSYRRSSYGERAYDRERERYRSAHYDSTPYPRTSSSYQSSSSNRAGEGRHSRPSRTDDANRVDHQSNKLSEDRDGIKTRDLGYAFIGKEKQKYLHTHLRGQLSNKTSKEERDEAEGSPVTRLMPRDVVLECKKSGHFDAIRKDILQEFQKSKMKESFFKNLEKYMLERMESLSSKERQKLAGQDQRLQHAELIRWIEEGKGAADLFDNLFKELQGKNEDQSLIGLLAQQDGRLEKDIHGRLQDVIHEKKRMQNSTNEADSDEDANSSMNTPIFKSSATPSGRNTPRDVASLGNQTPLPS